MKLLFVTYRWGDALVGGAEIHHQRLVRDLLALGHDVEVWTTTGREITPAAHWAVEWSAGYPAGAAEENGVRVRRFALDPAGRKPLQLAAKLLQRQHERETAALDAARFADIAARQPDAARPGVHLLPGWHHVELSFEGYVARWTHPQAHVAVLPLGAPGRLYLSGNAARPVHFSVRDGAGNFHHFDEKGKFEIELPIARAKSGTDFVSIFVDKAWRPLTDHRTLGLYLHSVRWQPEGESRAVEADLWNDYRALGRLDPEAWWEMLWRAAESRPARWSRLFDWLRGPRSSALKRALRNPPPGCDAVIAANLPWSIVPMVARECPLPLFAMALWHIEDDYYYWAHYIEALRGARLVLANTPYAAERFYARRGIRAEFVGPGVPLVDDPAEPFDVAGWRARHGIGDGEKVVLGVSRKSPEKRYATIAEAVERLNREPGRKVRFVLAGPDMDSRTVPPSTLYLGRVDDAELDAAYRACDVFVLMSDTESFGMVLAEAWLRGRPVIANERCGPAASLVKVGTDGLLARDAESLARAIAELVDDPARADAMGRAGRERAAREFTQRAATMRFLKAAEEVLGSSGRK